MKMQGMIVRENLLKPIRNAISWGLTSFLSLAHRDVVAHNELVAHKSITLEGRNSYQSA